MQRLSRGVFCVAFFLVFLPSCGAGPESLVPAPLAKGDVWCATKQDAERAIKVAPRVPHGCSTLREPKVVMIEISCITATDPGKETVACKAHEIVDHRPTAGVGYIALTVNIDTSAAPTVARNN